MELACRTNRDPTGNPMPLTPGTELAFRREPARSGQAAWARCIRPATRVRPRRGAEDVADGCRPALHQLQDPRIQRVGVTGIGLVGHELPPRKRFHIRPQILLQGVVDRDPCAVPAPLPERRAADIEVAHPAGRTGPSPALDPAFEELLALDEVPGEHQVGDPRPNVHWKQRLMMTQTLRDRPGRGVHLEDLARPAETHPSVLHQRLGVGGLVDQVSCCGIVPADAAIEPGGRGRR